jgi:choline dehydrogenase-like flavoprotein
MEPYSISNCDVIIAGTGPGGATVARELARRGKKVVMMEWGPGGPVRGNIWQYITELLIPGKSLLVTHGMLSMVRGITAGGSSMFYYGTCFPVPLEMLKSYGVDIQDEVEEARRELPIAPLKDEMFTPMAGRIQQGARQAGFEWNRLEKFMYQDRWKPGMPFGYYGDRNAVKWSARMYVDEAVSLGAVLMDRAKVSRVIIENGKATGVEYYLAGRLCAISAPVVVVAAGGIGTPMILRNSGIKEAGFDFFFDPLITVAGTISDVKTGNDEIPMSAGTLLEDDGYMMTDLPLSRLTHFMFTGQVLRLHRLFSFRSTARIMIKARDSLGGRITDGGGVRKHLSREDRDKLLHGCENARKVLKEAGAKDIYKTWYFAAHPGGTVKIGHLVDSTLKTQYDNLYVCDCSVIPKAWGLPPTLTIIGLGKHLARHLTEEKGKKVTSSEDQVTRG